MLNKLLNVDSVIINISSGEQVLSKLSELQSHFEVYGTPVMIGGGVLAYTLLAVQVDEEKPEESQFLILDPHYKASDDLKVITDSKKGGVWWKGRSLFNPKSFYNFCCPRPNSG